MKIELVEGFDQAPGASDIKALLEGQGYRVNGAGTLGWAEGRAEDSQALQLTQDDANIDVERTFTVTGDKQVIGFSLFATERAQVVEVDGGPLTLGWDDDGLQLRDQTSTVKPIRDRWYYIELVIDQAAMTCTLWVNDVEDVSAVLPDPVASASEITYRFGGVNPTNEAGREPPDDGSEVPTEMRLDDVYVADERWGPVVVYTRFPDADDTSEWDVPGEEGDPHWEEVTHQPPTDAHYIVSAATGATDTFTSSKTIPVDAEILAVAVTARARKGDIDDRALGLILGGDEKQQDTLTLDSEYYSQYFAAPSGTPWTAAEIESRPFGVAVR